MCQVSISQNFESPFNYVGLPTVATAPWVESLSFFQTLIPRILWFPSCHQHDHNCWIVPYFLFLKTVHFLSFFFKSITSFMPLLTSYCIYIIFYAPLPSPTLSHTHLLTSTFVGFLMYIIPFHNPISVSQLQSNTNFTGSYFCSLLSLPPTDTPSLLKS